MNTRNTDREAKAAEKVSNTMQVMERHFNDDGLCIPLSEATTLEKRVEQRFEEKNIAVWDGDDLEEADEDDAKVAQSRFAMKERLRICRSQTFAIVFVTRCALATEKDPEHMCTSAFRRALEDAVDAGLKLSQTVLAKYLERASVAELGRVKIKIGEAWEQLCEVVQSASEVSDPNEVASTVVDADAFHEWAMMMSSVSPP